MTVMVDVPEPNSHVLMRRVAGHTELVVRLMDGHSAALLFTDESFVKMVIQWREHRAHELRLPVSEVTLEQAP